MNKRIVAALAALVLAGGVLLGAQANATPASSVTAVKTAVTPPSDGGVRAGGKVVMCTRNVDTDRNYQQVPSNGVAKCPAPYSETDLVTFQQFTASVLASKGPKGDTGATGPAGVAGPKGDAAPVTTITTLNPLTDQTYLTNVGGAIRTGAVAVTESKTLPAGTYQVDIYGDFHRNGTGADDAAGNETRGSLFLWTGSTDGTYDWASSPTDALGHTYQTGPIAKTPTGSDEASAGGSFIVVLTSPTVVRLGAFAYNSNTSAYGTGTQAFGVMGASATFQSINVG